MVTAYEAPDLTPLAGDPAELDAVATEYREIAEAVLRVAGDLERIASQTLSVGDSVTAIRDRIVAANGDVGDVEPRYAEAGAALSEYSVALGEAQQAARTAIDERDDLVSQLWELYALRAETDERVRAASHEGAIPTDVLDESNRIAHRIRQAEDDLHAAWMRHLDAAGMRDDAAMAAARRIVAGALGTNDGVADRLAQWWDDATDLLAAAGEWIANILFEALWVLMLAELLVLALVFAALLLAVFAGPVGMAWLLSGGLEDWQGSLEALIGAALAVLPALTVFLHVVLAAEALAGTPTMRPLKPYDGLTREQLLLAMGDDPDGVGDYALAFRQNGFIDREGAGAETVVQIVRTGTDAEGRPIWRVTLPSTQDWQLPGDTGAANDLGSNLALILTPEQQAQYERMVLDAMSAHGIGADDPVMLVGFSQGGILAGKLASGREAPFNVEAVLTGGAPIDHFDIPDDVSVLSFQHESDVVPLLDGTPPPPNTDSRYTITAPNRQGESAHGATSYAKTAGDRVPTDSAEITDPHLRAIVEDQERFFSENEIAYHYAGRES